MPELPEVETIRRGLEELIVGRELQAAEDDNPHTFPNDKQQVQNFLLGSRIINVERRGKALLINLSSNYSLLIHLRMTGQLVYIGLQRFGAGHPTKSLINALPDKSTRVILTFKDSSKLFFNDQRKFGYMKLLATNLVEEDSFIKKLGPDALSKELTAGIFIKRLKKRKGSSIKATILDQTILAGIGNIYADEGLWASGIHPSTPVGHLTDDKVVKLHVEIVRILKLSIKLGGSTDRNYIDAGGREGSYLEFAKVFRREGQQCLVCDNEIVKIRVAGRGTHVCTRCQTIE